MCEIYTLKTAYSRA